MLFSLALLSCSVKENRTECPVMVTLDVMNGNDIGLTGMLHLQGWREDVCVFDRFLDFGTFVREGLTLSTVYHGEMSFSGLLGWGDDNSADESGLLLIPLGEECPRAFGFYEEGVLVDDLNHFDFVMQQLYANMYIKVHRKADAGYSFRPVVHSTTDGFYFPSFKSHAGSFQFLARSNQDGNYEARVPRNVAFTKSSSEPCLGLEFECLDASDNTWFPMLDIDIEQYLNERNYDWGAAVLSDIVIDVTLADEVISRVTLTVDGWTVVIIDDYVI